METQARAPWETELRTSAARACLFCAATHHLYCDNRQQFAEAHAKPSQATDHRSRTSRNEGVGPRPVATPYLYRSGRHSYESIHGARCVLTSGPYCVYGQLCRGSLICLTKRDSGTSFMNEVGQLRAHIYIAPVHIVTAATHARMYAWRM
jgi:hypothetical protein